MGHTIVDKSKLTVVAVATTMAALSTDLQAALRGSDFANGDKLIEISVIRNKHSNDVMAYITFEDQ
jgi:hypothetical protein